MWWGRFLPAPDRNRPALCVRKRFVFILKRGFSGHWVQRQSDVELYLVMVGNPTGSESSSRHQGALWVSPAQTLVHSVLMLFNIFHVFRTKLTQCSCGHNMLGQVGLDLTSPCSGCFLHSVIHSTVSAGTFTVCVCVCESTCVDVNRCRAG